MAKITFPPIRLAAIRAPSGTKQAAFDAIAGSRLMTPAGGVLFGPGKLFAGPRTQEAMSRLARKKIVAEVKKEAADMRKTLAIMRQAEVPLKDINQMRPHRGLGPLRSEAHFIRKAKKDTLDNVSIRGQMDRILQDVEQDIKSFVRRPGATRAMDKIERLLHLPRPLGPRDMRHLDRLDKQMGPALMRGARVPGDVEASLGAIPKVAALKPTAQELSGLGRYMKATNPNGFRRMFPPRATGPNIPLSPVRGLPSGTYQPSVLGGGRVFQKAVPKSNLPPQGGPTLTQ